MIWFFAFKTNLSRNQQLVNVTTYVSHKWHSRIAKVSPAYLQHILWHTLISAAQVNRNDRSMVAAKHWQQRCKNKSRLRGVKMQFICFEFGVTFWRTIKWSENEKCTLQHNVGKIHTYNTPSEREREKILVSRTMLSCFRHWTIRGLLYIKVHGKNMRCIKSITLRWGEKIYIVIYISKTVTEMQSWKKREFHRMECCAYCNGRFFHLKAIKCNEISESCVRKADMLPYFFILIFTVNGWTRKRKLFSFSQLLIIQPIKKII